MPGTVMAAALSPKAASARVSSPLCEITTRFAMNFAAGETAVDVVAARSAALAQEVLRSMLFHKLRLAAFTFLLVAAGATCAGYRARLFAIKDEPRRPPAAAQSQVAAKAEPTAAAPAPGRMLVGGRVLDPQGKPVPNAAVMVYARTNLPTPSVAEPIGTARCDGSGRFRVETPRTSSLTHDLIGAIAIAPGHAAGWVELDPDAKQLAADITLRPEQVIAGRLLDVKGLPARGVDVSVDSMGHVVRDSSNPLRERLEGPPFWSNHAKDLPAWPAPAITDTEGRFTIHGVGRAMRVMLGVRDPRFALQSIPVDTDAIAASKQVSLALEPARNVTGRVTYADTGKPVPHAQISVGSWKQGTGTPAYGETDGEGRFRVNSWSGDRYDVRVFPRGATLPGRRKKVRVAQRGARVLGRTGHAAGHVDPRQDRRSRL